VSDELVFVIDDDESIRRNLSRLIRSSGRQVQAFPSAKAFLESTPPDRPACLVLDVQMPGLSGLELQTALARARREIPIVFITGHGDVPSSVRAMKGGAVDFLQKPFDGQELLTCVDRALARSREQRAERAERAVLQRRLETLTPREYQVLRLVVTGRLNKQMAGDLGIAEKTFKIHRGRVMAKMEAASVAELVRMVDKLGEGATREAPAGADERSSHAAMGDAARDDRGAGRAGAGR
jgi:FixJ family two-component response regulator